MLYVSGQANQTPFRIIVNTQYKDSIIKFYFNICIHRRLYMHYHSKKPNYLLSWEIIHNHTN